MPMAVTGLMELKFAGVALRLLSNSYIAPSARSITLDSHTSASGRSFYSCRILERAMQEGNKCHVMCG